MRNKSAKVSIVLIALTATSFSTAVAATTKATPKPTAKASAKPTAKASPGSSFVLPPVIIDPSTVRTATISMKSALVFNLPDETGITANISNRKVAEFFPGGSQGTYTTHPGVKPLSVGTSYIVVQKYGAMVGVVKLTVTN